MSLLTRCPRCAAVYQVTDEQLQASAGWVRCGQCTEVFDAAVCQMDVVEVAPPVNLTAPIPDSAASAMPDVPATPAFVPVPASVPESAQESGPAPAPEQAPVSEPTTTPAWQTTPAPATAALPAEPPASPTSQPLLRKESAPEPWPQPDLAPAQPARKAPSWTSPGESAVLLPMQPAQASGRSRAGVRLALLASCVLLVLAVLLQWLYVERDRLASVRPELKPLLQMLCQPLGCRVSALRSSEALAIDGSAFVLAGKDSYRLSFVVKNQSHLAVAVPHIELTLTDSLDHALVRRVLTPQDLGATSDALAAGQSWPVSVAFRLDQDQARVLGYRLLAFYP